ncbi:hypothetical protein MKW98_016341 [Papaver atlanticum]|uniref:Uncharacterized protein n=1 Tax=Papaver atlanticum TaxID=357466 RepID=A0AAD4XG05_9MAGN|nr:hypothetical protein MKW98_016341 [Papaver atlanticum]
MMFSSKSSQVWFLLFAVVALSLCSETESQKFFNCRKGETLVRSPSVRGNNCTETNQWCKHQCAKVGKIAVYNECHKGLFIRSVACCGSPPKPCPSPPRTSIIKEVM